jgi:hypothetical protein
MAIIAKAQDKDIISRIREQKAEDHRNGVCYTTGTPFERVSPFDNYPEELKPPHTTEYCSICGYRLEKS